MNCPLFILSAAMIAGCATHPYEGTYRSGNGTLTLTHAGRLSYHEGGVRGEGSYRAAGQNCISARVDKRELKLSLIGSDKKMEWISRGPECWHFVVLPADGTCRRFYGAEPARRYSEYLSSKRTSCLVEGAILKPGVYSFDGDISLPELVQQAGGYQVKGWAVVMAASVARGEETIRIDLRETSKEEQDAFKILPGDIVRIIQSIGL